MPKSRYTILLNETEGPDGKSVVRTFEDGDVVLKLTIHGTGALVVQDPRFTPPLLLAAYASGSWQRVETSLVIVGPETAQDGPESLQ